MDNDYFCNAYYDERGTPVEEEYYEYIYGDLSAEEKKLYRKLGSLHNTCNAIVREFININGINPQPQKQKKKKNTQFLDECSFPYQAMSEKFPNTYNLILVRLLQSVVAMPSEYHIASQCKLMQKQFYNATSEIGEIHEQNPQNDIDHISNPIPNDCIYNRLRNSAIRHIVFMAEIIASHIQKIDDIETLYCILHASVVLGNTRLFQVIMTPNIDRQLHRDCVYTYFKYVNNFWNDLCCRKPCMEMHDIDDLQNGRISITNALTDMYPHINILTTYSHLVNGGREFHATNHMRDCYRKGLYLVGDFIYTTATKQGVNVDLEFMFIWGCETGTVKLVEHIYRLNPYKFYYHIDNTITATNVNPDNTRKNTTEIYTDTSLNIKKGTTHIGHAVIRCRQNERWEMQRLLLHLKYLPTDTIREIYQYLR